MSLSFGAWTFVIEIFVAFVVVFDRCKTFEFVLSSGCSLLVYDNKEFWKRRNNGKLTEDFNSK